MHNHCDGVVECTALVLAESCAEVDDRLTLFGILDELRLPESGESSFVVYAKFEGCEHVTPDTERRAHILVTDEEGTVLMESAEYTVWLDGTEEPVTIVAVFDLTEDFGNGESVLWVEAVLDDETLSQTVVRLHDRYSV
jgi:hypothetical protein